MQVVYKSMKTNTTKNMKMDRGYRAMRYWAVVVCLGLVVWREVLGMIAVEGNSNANGVESGSDNKDICSLTNTDSKDTNSKDTNNSEDKLDKVLTSALALKLKSTREDQWQPLESKIEEVLQTLGFRWQVDFKYVSDSSIDGGKKQNNESGSSDESSLVEQKFMAKGYVLNSDGSVKTDRSVGCNLQELKSENIGYRIRVMGYRLIFQLHEYEDVSMANKELDVWRRIVSIRVRHVYVGFDLNGGCCYNMNLLIVSRIVNTFDCEKLVIGTVMKQDRELRTEGPGHVTNAQKEAYNAFSRINYKLACQVEFTALGAREWINANVALLRSVKAVVLKNESVNCGLILSSLALIDDYTFVLDISNSGGTFDFGFLHNSSPRCSRIVIISVLKNVGILTGLEQATTTIDSTITLISEWSILRYIAKHNPTEICVHTLIGTGCDPVVEYQKTKTIQVVAEARPIILARKVITTIPNTEACGVLGYYQKYYNRQACLQYGISADEDQFQYDSGRNHILLTLARLNKFGGLAQVPCEFKMQKRVCDGHQMSGSQTSLPQIDLFFQLRHYMMSDGLIISKHMRQPFCQHIRYNSITIKGPYEWVNDYISSCFDLLNRFRNLTAQKLTLANIDKVHGQMGIFNIDMIKTSPPDQPKYHLNIKTLVLSNVHRDVIYTLLNNYSFVNPIELHILNQYNQNLAIAQILSLPISNLISKLVIDDFVELEEVKNHTIYTATGKFKEFSLFNYIKTMANQNKTLDDLGLKKLFLQLHNVDCMKYANVLSEFSRFGVQYQIVSLNSYFSNIINSYNNVRETMGPWHTEAVDDIMFDNLSMRALETDLTDNSPQKPTTTNFARVEITPDSVDSLILYFDGTDTLTENNLIAILRWITHRFGHITNLNLINIKLDDRDKHIMNSRYHIPNWLSASLIIKVKPDISKSDYIQLKTRQTLVCLNLSTNGDNNIVQEYINSKVLSGIRPILKVPAKLIPIPIPCCSKFNCTIPILTQPITPTENMPKTPNNNISCMYCKRKITIPMSVEENQDPRRTDNIYYITSCLHNLICHACINRRKAGSQERSHHSPLKSSPYCRTCAKGFNLAYKPKRIQSAKDLKLRTSLVEAMSTKPINKIPEQDIQMIKDCQLYFYQMRCDLDSNELMESELRIIYI
ncbi:hypothetical protein NEHOM01_1291 [Nematocida homosporus]|uniref:uncharacterized protein n=1 Tax=Nematocida homosporus TaxID=1912981 RepID=UPI00221F74CF|nr:uncharacterized protein NEHOM01_1291 [Nematocida homosporus]KAI5186109.1 hypothetical protein NEHOM01_1291 [Nematocida homosporus]